MCSTMSTSLVGRTVPKFRRIECGWVIRPPTRVHLSVGSTAAISATFGHHTTAQRCGCLLLGQVTHSEIMPSKELGRY
jgi:hypothetical protein